MGMFGWSDRPTKVEVRHFIGGDNPAAVFMVGQYEITARGANIEPGVELQISYTIPSRHQEARVSATFPNIEVRDGAMVLPIEDIVEAILARVQPAEIAVALWGDSEVREQFIYALTTRWSKLNVNDADRRKVLAEIKEAIHSKALDAFAYTAQKLEHSFGKKWFFYHEINRVNEWLHQHEIKDADGGTIRLRHEDSDPVFKISGEGWHEAREHWREEAAKLFGSPEDAKLAVEAQA